MKTSFMPDAGGVCDLEVQFQLPQDAERIDYNYGTDFVVQFTLLCQRRVLFYRRTDGALNLKEVFSEVARYLARQKWFSEAPVHARTVYDKDHRYTATFTVSTLPIHLKLCVQSAS